MSMSPRLMRPRATGFNVNALSGLVYWLDASQYSTVTIGTGVSEWRSASTSPIKATQAIGNNQPAYQTAAQNGKNAVYFDGTNDSMSLGNLSASFPSAATAIFAFKPDTDTEYSVYTTRNNSAFWAYPTATTYMGVFKTTRLNGVASSLMPTASASVLAITSSASAYRVYISNTLAHDVAADFSAGDNHRLGNNELGTFYKGWLYEAIFSSSELPVSTITEATKYLKAKWGI
jgi:hypothetical protein